MLRTAHSLHLHRKYIDIQYLFTGKEVQGYAPLLPGVTGEEPAGKDNIFYADVENELLSGPE